MRVFIVFFLLALPLVETTPAFARASQSSPSQKAYEDWYKFAEFGGLMVFQTVKRNIFTGEASWRPTYLLSNLFAVRGNLGFSLLKDSSDDSKYLALSYSALISCSQLDPFLLEAGVGAQTWFSHGGTNPLISAEVARKLDLKLPLPIDRVFVGYSAYLLSASLTHEIKAGVGFAL